MADNCVCGTSALGNTGVERCEITVGAMLKPMLMPKYNELGQLNFIDVSNPTTVGATIQTLTSATTHPMRRLYPLMVAENVTREKTETIYETAPSNRKYKAQEGVRTTVSQFFEASFRWLGELQKFGCTELVYFFADVEGKLVGQSTEDGKLYGIPVAKNTFDTMLMYATDTTVQKVQLQFDDKYGFNDANIRVLTPTDLGYDADELSGIITVYGEVVGTPTLTGAVVKLYTKNSNALSPKVPFKGLLVADFDLNEIDPTPGAVTIATAPESLVNDGQYTLTFASQTSGDTLELTATRNGFEVLPITIEIP